jgi:phospholipid/cholesterol/gamma-HCH transport system substrate-binding protein
MRWSAAAGVGVVVVIAAAILVTVYVLLASAGIVGNTYSMPVEFNNAQGVTKGTEVRLAGVKIGEVSGVDVSAGRRARLMLRIRQKYDVPPDADIRLATSGLLTAPVVEIVPKRRGPAEKGVRQGTSAPSLDELIPKGEELITNLSNLSQSMQELIGDRRLRNNLQRSTENMAVVTERGKAIAANLQQASQDGRQIASQFRLTTSRLDRTAAMVQETVAENRGKLRQTLVTVNDTLGAVQGLVEQMTVLVADPKVKGSLQNSASNIEQATANLAKLSSNLEKLSSDPKLNEDLRATVSGTRATVEETQRLFARLNKIVGSGGKAAEGAREQLRQTEFAVDLGQETSPGRPRIDVNAVVPAGPKRFYRVGLYDLGEGNRMNLQVGRPLGANSLRYGLYASRLGIGLDVGPPSHPRLSADLYGTDEPHLDVAARARLGRGLDLKLGVQSLFGDNAPMIGVTMRK